MKFYNRKIELRSLNDWWRAKRSQLVIIYGKRRVGKTALCLEFAKNKPSLYFLAEQLSPALQLKKLSTQVGRFFNDDYVAEYGINDWEQLFKYIAAKNKRFVLIIDEFPYLVEAESAIPSVFQKGWDLYLEKSSVYLMLCGSSIGMMEKHTLVYQTPLYGRRSGQILVQPFSIIDLNELFPEKSFNDKLLIYSTVGGTIAYLKYFIGQKNIWSVIKKHILSKEQFLYDEVEFLLREELREPRNYFSILLALSLGKRKLGEIINETGFDKSTLSSYLAILNQLRFAEKEVPVTEKYPEKSRKGLYRIADEYINFWFRFVFNNKNLLEEGRTGEVLKVIKRFSSELVSHNYENFAWEYLKKIHPTSFNYVGRWWYRNEEIDAVGINTENKTAVFGECKWTNKPVGTNIFVDLKRKAALVDWENNKRRESYILFSKSGFTAEMKRVAKKERIVLVAGDKLEQYNN